MRTAGLSKSRFQTGLQCPRALWLKCRRPEAADPLTETQRALFAGGTRVGELARERFAGGVLVEADHTQGAEALARTRELLADPPPAVFEAAFEHGGVFVRPDALVHLGGGAFDLYEVKSSTKVKPENLSDVAVQLWVLEGAGLEVRRAFLMHVDNTYVHGGGAYDLERLFAAEDVTDEARAWLPEIEPRVAEMQRMLAGQDPLTRIGKQCDSPYTCAFHGYCHAHLPERPVTSLPRVSEGLLARLLDDGILAIADVPPLYPGLTPAQRLVVDVVRDGRPRLNGDLARSLARLEHPVHFLDFETMMPALPLYAGTRPYQQVPFQWSDHVLHADGALEHREFLFDAEGDPRPAFAESLLEALGGSGSIVVYSSFEGARLRELAAALPRHADGIEAVRGRLFDLERVVARHVAHPACCGRTTIKLVLPALVAGLSYAGLGIADGGTASRRYEAVAAGTCTGEERERVLSDLREYCGLDTLAMVRLHEVLTQAARTGRLPKGA